MNRFFLFVLGFFIFAVGCNETRPGLKYETVDQLTQPTDDEFITVDVDYDSVLPIKEWLRSLENDSYQIADEKGLEKKPFENGKKILKMKVFYLSENPDFSPEGEMYFLLAEMEEQGYRLATLRELWAFRSNKESSGKRVSAFGSHVTCTFGEDGFEHFSPALSARGTIVWSFPFEKNLSFLAVRQF